MTDQRSLMPVVRFWLACVIFLAATDAWAIFAHREAVTDSVPYAWAFDVLPGWVFAWGWTFAAVAAWVSLALDRRGRIMAATTLARASLIVHAFLGSLIGLAILQLALDGVPTSIMGTSKWWLTFIVPVRLLRMGGLTGRVME